MAIYKSSFNQKPEKEEKPKKEKKEKIKQPKEQFAKKINIRPSAICLCVFLLLFVVICFPQNFIKNFLLGMFGLSAYPLLLVGSFLSIVCLRKQKYNAKKKYIIYIAIAVIMVWFILHLILTSKISTNSFGVYLVETYKAKTTAGGLIFSLISYPVVKILTYVGAYIISGIVLAIFVGLIIDYITVEKNLKQVEKKTKFTFESLDDFTIDEKPIETISHEEHAKKVAKQRLGLEKGETTIISSNMPKYNYEELSKTKNISKKDYILTPLEPVIKQDETKNLFTTMPKKPYLYEKINKPQKSNFGFNSENTSSIVSGIIPTTANWNNSKIGGVNNPNEASSIAKTNVFAIYAPDSDSSFNMKSASFSLSSSTVYKIFFSVYADSSALILLLSVIITSPL